MFSDDILTTACISFGEHRNEANRNWYNVDSFNFVIGTWKAEGCDRGEAQDRFHPTDDDPALKLGSGLQVFTYTRGNQKTDVCL